MENLLRRHFWVVDLIGIAIGAALAGHAVATLIGSTLPRQPPSSPRGQIAPRAPVSAASKSIEGIVGRNIFCATCDGAPAPERSQRAFTLLAVMFAPPPSDPRWSVAVIRDDEAATTGPYGVGARLGDATIESIAEVYVVLDVGRGRRELLELLRRRPRAPPNGRGAPAAAFGDGVRKTGTHSYELRRAALDQFLAGGATPPWPRVVPQSKDGAPIGFRLFGIASDGPFAAIGLENGDVLREVNGRSIATPDAALAAFAALRTASHVWLAVERDGRRIRMDYVIR